ESRSGFEVEDALRVVGRCVVDSGAASRTLRLAFQRLPMCAEARLGEAQEDEAEDRLRVLRRAEPRICAELVCCRPQPAFERFGSLVLLWWCYPTHAFDSNS